MTQPIHQTNASGRRQNGRRSAVRKTACLLMTLVTTDVSAQQKPTTGELVGTARVFPISPHAGCHHLSELLSNQNWLPLAEGAGYAERS